MPVEYLDDQGDELGDALLGMFTDFIRADTMDEATASQTRIAACTITLTRYNVLRQWAAIGQFGYWLAVLERQGLLASEPVLKVPFIIGLSHETIETHFTRYFNIPVETQRVEHGTEAAREDTRRACQHFASIVTTTTIHPEQLLEPLF